MTPTPSHATDQAARVSEAAAARAGVVMAEVEEMTVMHAVSALFEQVWGRNDEGVPLSSEVLRALAHAGGAVTVARSADGTLAGAAALVLSPDAGTYSLIAAAAPGGSDRGIGYALKLRQRAWALSRGLTSMTWTFDPLVGRNARFNLTKLGARASEYVPGFYGEMHDEINQGDDSDRLVATWRLAGASAVAATEGTAIQPEDPLPASVLATGPDGEPAYVTDATGVVWIRVPGDIVAVRRGDAAAAAAWRACTREAFTDALAKGAVASGMTRTGWYQLSNAMEEQA
jgi:predicted GNAT superfamily acetyltransferase